MASDPLSVSGLASGLDTSSLIERLMALERIPRARLDVKQRQIEARKTILNDIASRLRLLQGAAADLRSTALWADKQTVESGDATKMTAKLTAGAGPGGYQVEVLQMARAAQRSLAYPPPGGTLTINGTAVDLSTVTDAAGAAAAINADSSTGVFAVAISETEIALASRQAGAAASITVNGDPAVYGLDAQVRVNGGAVTTHSSNVVTTAIPGVELTLKGVTTSAVTVTVGAPGVDTEAVKKKIQSFVEAYNSTIDFIRSRINEKPMPDAKTSADQLKGVMYGDSMLRGLLSTLRSAVSGSGLAGIGVSTGGFTGGKSSADSLAGKLTIDDAKLSAALAADPQSVRAMLGGVTGTSGFAQAFEAVLTPLTQADGVLAGRTTAADSELARLRRSMADMDARLELKQERLRAQFAAMEAALSNSQQQGQWLAGQLASLL